MHKTKYIELILYKTYADLTAEASQTYLSFLWWIVEPLLYMTVFYFVFGLLFQRGGGADYIPFLLCGLTFWKWFDSTVRVGSNSIIINANLMRQVYVPKIVFPTITILQNTVKFSIILALLLGFLKLYGINMGATYICLPALILVQLLFIAACTYLLCAIVPFVPDIAQFIGNGMVLLMFLSGIFYPIENIPHAYQNYFYLNPMAILLEAYRDTMLYARWPNWTALGWVSLASIAGMWAAYKILFKFDRTYPRLAG
jgi:lipopolysaccharide transport system permease protein